MSKTFLVTRAKGDEEEILHELQSRGFRVIHEPLTEILLDHTLRGTIENILMNEPDAIIVTSKHAVQALALLTELRDSMILCVGDSTAQTAASLGFARIAVGGGTVEHLIDYIQQAYDDEARFLYISGAHIRSDLPAIVESFGMQCERLVAYEAIAAEALSDTVIEQLKRGQIDAVTLFSPRNAKIFCDLLKKHDAADCSLMMDVHCLSHDVADAARKLAWQKVYVASEPTLASLVESVDNAYS